MLVQLRNHFHTAELTFRPALTARSTDVRGLTSGRENFNPSRWYPLACVERSERARRYLEARGCNAKAASGALGISSEITASASCARRTARSIPPALTFSAVANSRISFPLSSRLRTKTGMASGKRGHLRRSPSLFRFTRGTFPNEVLTRSMQHSRGQMTEVTPNKRKNGQRTPTTTPQIPRPASQFPHLSSLYIRMLNFLAILPKPRRSASFCYTWVIRLRFPLTLE
jgi:hypothetical protein